MIVYFTLKIVCKDFMSLAYNMGKYVYVYGKNFVGKNFSSAKIFVTCQKFRHFLPTKILA